MRMKCGTWLLDVATRSILYSVAVGGVGFGIGYGAAAIAAGDLLLAGAAIGAAVGGFVAFINSPNLE